MCFAHGMPVCSGARDLRAQSAPGFPCALSSEGDNEFAKLRRKCAVRMRAYVYSRVPDAVQHAVLLRRAGTHTFQFGIMGPGSAARRHKRVYARLRRTMALRCVQGTRVVKSASPYTASTQ